MRLFILSTIGTRVSEARKAKGLSQKDLAELIGTTQQTITNIETKSTSSRYLLKIAEVLDVTYEWIMKGETSRPPVNKEDRDEHYIKVSIEAFEQAVTGFKSVSLSRGDDISGFNFELLKDAFIISLRGKITGDYITASLASQSLKKKA